MAPALQGVCEGLACFVGVQSCVRPVCAVMTAGPDGFRGRAPILLCGLRRPGHYGGVFSFPVPLAFLGFRSGKTWFWGPLPSFCGREATFPRFGAVPPGGGGGLG